MNQEVKAKWVEALRSGKYKQGRKTLKHAGRYCCLGVLCEVAGEPIERFHNNLNNPFMERVGFPWGQHGVLIEMNDTKKKSFAEIADYVEQNL